MNRTSALTKAIEAAVTPEPLAIKLTKLASAPKPLDYRKYKRGNTKGAVNKPDSPRLRKIDEVTIGAGGHKPERRLVLTTVVNGSKLYPYNSAKRDWRARIDRDAQEIKGPWGA